jgi:hypothetical protein
MESIAVTKEEKNEKEQSLAEIIDAYSDEEDDESQD